MHLDDNDAAAKSISPEFWPTNDDLDLEEASVKVMMVHGADAVAALMQRRSAPGWKGKGSKTWKPKGFKKPDGRQDGEPWSKPDAKPTTREIKCGKCGRAGHVST